MRQVFSTPFCKSNSSGQSLIEFTIWLPLFLLAIGGGIRLLKKQYDRIQCSKLVFESTREALNRNGPSSVRLTKTKKGIIGRFHCGGRNYYLSLNSLSNEGFVFFPILIFIGIISISSLTLSFLHLRYKKSVETQLALDTCVATIVKKSVSTLNQFEQINKNIPVLRASVIASSAIPPANVTARALLTAAHIRQIWLKTEWYSLAMYPIIKRNCGIPSYQIASFYKFPYLLSPPDSIGPNAFFSETHRYPINRGKYLNLTKDKRQSCAEVFYEEENNRWNAEWVHQC